MIRRASPAFGGFAKTGVWTLCFRGELKCYGGFVIKKIVI